jgi:TRAP transporter TAXI family solute receptor
MTIRIGTAEPDSTFLTQGQALAAILSAHGAPGPYDVLMSPAASIDNANRLDRGEIDLGFMAANWIGRAKRGDKPFSAPIDLRMVAPMNVGPLFFIVRAGSGIETFDDLAGKRVAVGPAGSGMTQHAHTMMAAFGKTIDHIEPAYLSFAEGAKALAAGDIDAQLQCPIPNKVMTAIDAEVPLTIVRFTSAQLDTMLARVSFYRRAIMRKGALRALTGDVSQPGVLNVLVCHARADQGRIAAITTAIHNGAEDLARRNALFDGLDELFLAARTEGSKLLEPDGVKLHDGAREAYAAAGMLV